MSLQGSLDHKCPSFDGKLQALFLGAKYVLASVVLGMFFMAPCFADWVYPSAPTQLAWFYKPPTDGTTPAQLAANFQNFILTQNDESYRDQLKALGVKAPIFQYVRSDAIHNPCNGTCPCATTPYGNQVAWNVGDYCAIKTSHPDWFLRDTQGDIVEGADGSQLYSYMDPANAEWQQFFLARVKSSQETKGWDGLFLDNVQAGLGQFQANNVVLQKYTNDVSFRMAVQGFLATLYDSYFHLQNRPLNGNITSLPWLNENVAWFDLIKYLDGAMEEAFAMGWSSGEWLTPQQWSDQLTRLELSQGQGKRIIAVSQDSQTATSRQNFGFASYLLIANGMASFRYTGTVGDEYEQVWLYPNYTDAKALGAPKGPRYNDTVHNSWRRDFENGYVLVYPVNHLANIVLNTAPPSDKIALHVSSLKMWYTGRYTVSTEVRVKDSSNAYPPRNTSVSVTTKLPNGTTSVSIGVVDQWGIVTFSVKSSLKGTYTSSVTNISGSNVIYDSAKNVATTASITVR
jgi:hypothetical protein